MADKIFQELGYNLVNTIFTIDYEKEDEYIVFNIKGKTFSKYSADITMLELQAIFKKCQELGWLN